MTVTLDAITETKCCNIKIKWKTTKKLPTDDFWRNPAMYTVTDQWKYIWIRWFTKMLMSEGPMEEKGILKIV